MIVSSSHRRWSSTRVWIAIGSINLFLLAGFFIFDLVSPAPASALSGGQVSIARASGPWFVNDSNNCAGGAGPHAAYVVYRVTNTSGGALSNLQAGISGFSAGFGLAGGQVITQYLGALANGASRDVYWYVSYPCTMDTPTTLTVTVVDGNPGSVTFNDTLTTRSNISANAGGNLFSTTLGPGYVLGQVLPYTVTYDFGNINNADLTFQPAGNTTFNAGCFQLTGGEVISFTGFTGIAVGNKDLYYTNVDTSGSNNYLTVRYSILYMCNGISTSAQAYASSKSGTQYKYTTNYSDTQFISTFPAGSNPFTLTKSVTPRNLPVGGGVVTYTVRITNTSAFDSQFDSITDTLTTNLPNPAVYGGVTGSSQINAANSSQMPNVGATGSLRWVGQPSSYYRVLAGSTLTLVYTETLGGGSGRYTNTLTAISGKSQITPTQAVVYVNDPTATTLSSFDARADSLDGALVTVGLIGLVMLAAGVWTWRRAR